MTRRFSISTQNSQISVTNDQNHVGGMVGVWNVQNASQIIHTMLYALQHRGQDSCGITTVNLHELLGYRGVGLLNEVFDDRDKVECLLGDSGMGCVSSMDPVELRTLRGLQPLIFQHEDQNISLIHSGNITNAKSLRQGLERQGAVFHSNSDGELLFHLMRHSGQASIEGQFKAALKQFTGAFNVILMTNEQLFAAVDQHSIHPLVVGKLAEAGYVIASETCALDVIGADFQADTLPGHYWIIDREGARQVAYQASESLAIESFEFIYYSRPDSQIHGINVHRARKNMGIRLAHECPAPKNSIVVGIPNSSLSAAMGYAEASGLPYEMGLIKNQYIGRTFIAPTQDERESKVRTKLSAVKGIVQDQSVVLIDDSLVRGTTMTYIVKLLKEAGAREVHVRIACPPILFPNYYGVNTNDNKELMAANYSIEAMRQILACDSLDFLSLEGLVESIGLDQEGQGTGLNLNSFNGVYPTSLSDYQAAFEAALTDRQIQYFKERNEGHGCEQ